MGGLEPEHGAAHDAIGTQAGLAGRRAHTRAPPAAGGSGAAPSPGVATAIAEQLDANPSMKLVRAIVGCQLARAERLAPAAQFSWQELEAMVCVAVLLLRVFLSGKPEAEEAVAAGCFDGLVGQLQAAGLGTGVRRQGHTAASLQRTLDYDEYEVRAPVRAPRRGLAPSFRWSLYPSDAITWLSHATQFGTTFKKSPRRRSRTSGRRCPRRSATS